jgi:hypothetical protein
LLRQRKSPKKGDRTGPAFGFPCAAGHQRAVRETRPIAAAPRHGLRHAPGTAPLLPRTAAASPSGPTASACEDRGGQTQSCNVSTVGRCHCPRRRRAAQGAREGSRACLSERPQGASLQARPRPRAAQGSRRSRPPSRARLLLVTFLGKTREVMGRAALKRTVEGRKPSTRSGKRVSTLSDKKVSTRSGTRASECSATRTPRRQDPPAREQDGTIDACLPRSASSASTPASTAPAMA